jgi:hypothetical protein
VIYTEDAERIFGPRQWKSRTEEIVKDAPAVTAQGDNDNSGENVSMTPPPFQQDSDN